ncbi:cell cycle progression, putative [Ixodes scapularis]|uniref:Cell cycle progression, putative n=1 Tax=Ixodes scapularis TaxID=6945 RepID=B7QDG1_IXOSC|nr:cell cycle progression, putative [Ixodes scapularis]|eukprot:XP_002413576.1 cell cycle progression, putative [Ixodes scapularis]
MFAVSRTIANPCRLRVAPFNFAIVGRHAPTVHQALLLSPGIQERIRQPASFTTATAPQANALGPQPQPEINFSTVCNRVVDGREQGLGDGVLVSGLRRLLESDVPCDAHTLACFEQSILWRARKMKLHNLCICLSYHIRYQKTELQKQVVRLLQSRIRSQVAHASTVSDVIWLLDASEHVGDRKFLLEVEDRALQLMGSLKPQDIRLLVRALARLKLRPTPLLQAAAFYLGKGHGGASLKEVVTLMHALQSLSFPEPAVLLQLTEAFLSQLDDGAKASLVSACLTSVGQVAWRHPELLEACASWITKHAADCRPHDLASCLLALARLQYVPDCSPQLFPLLLERLTPDHFQEVPAVWLDLVWSLALLGLAERHHLDSVLRPEFYTPLLEPSSHVAASSRHKLLNIIAISDLESPDSSRFPKDVISSLLETHKVGEPGALHKSVRDALSNLAPLGRYLLTNPSLPYGIAADGEMIVDKNLQPVLLESTIQPEHKRIALVVLDFKDLTLHTQVPTGSNALRLRLLRKLGYGVLEVPYTEYDEKKPVLQRVKYLQEKLRLAVASEHT